MKDENLQTQAVEQQDREIQALLKDYPMPEPGAAFYDQALARAMHEGSRRQRRRWIMTGFGSAVAAGLALWFVGGFFFAAPVAPEAEPGIPGITMTLEEPRTVNLVFASATALDSALLTIALPDGIELAGFPGQREVAWQTSLREGKNLLPLKLVAVSPAGGEVLARLEHNNRGRTFRLRIEVS
ncbi:MAG: hypothetical protein WBM80_00080 [Woeseiaceae bacterium]